MLAIGSDGILDSPVKFKDKKEIEKNLKIASPRRIFAIARALWKRDFSVDDIHRMTKIDFWFLQQIEKIITSAHQMKKKLTPEILREAKVLGFSDGEIARISKKGNAMDIRALRKKHKIIPVTKQIDTLAAEFPAKTNYLYTTFLGEKNDV